MTGIACHVVANSIARAAFSLFDELFSILDFGVISDVHGKTPMGVTLGAVNHRDVSSHHK